MAHRRFHLLTICGLVLVALFFGPSIGWTHCECGGIVGAFHCKVYHGGICAEDEGKSSPRDELEDEPEPEVESVSILDTNGKKINTLEVGEEFRVEVKFDREPEHSKLTVTIMAFTPDGATRNTARVTAKKTSRRTVFVSLPVQVTEP